MEIDGAETNRKQRTEPNERDQAYPTIHYTSWYLELPLLASTCVKIEHWKRQTNNTQNMHQHVHYRMQSIAIIVQKYFSYRFFFERNHLKSQRKNIIL